jgi:hypothetical protein
MEMEEARQEGKEEIKKEEVKKEVKGGGKSFNFKVLMINILVSFLVSVGVVYVYDRYYAQKIVAFDLKGYVMGLRNMYLAGKINDEGLKQAIEAAYLAVRGQAKNKVVIMGDVILSPVERIEYPVKIEFSSLPFFNMNGMNGTLGGVGNGSK